MLRSLKRERINPFHEVFRGVPIPSRGLAIKKNPLPGTELSQLEKLCRAEEGSSYMDVMSRIIFDHLKERKKGREKSVVRIGDIEFKSQLVYARRGHRATSFTT